MAESETKIYHGLSGLASIADELNRLDRSSAERYDCSSRIIESYVRSFASEELFSIATVWENGKLLAALPYLAQRHLGVFQIARNLSNEWIPGRFAILEPNANTEDLIDKLLAGLATEGISSLEADFVTDDSHSVNHFLSWATKHRASANVIPKFQCGRIHLQKDWEQFTKGWSKNRRKFVRRNERKLNEEGPLYLVAAHRSDSKTVEAYFDECLKIEDRCWKGDAATSLLKNENALSCFRDSMKSWHQSGRLQLYLLKCNGRPIAFDFGYIKNRIASSIKISYLDNYAQFSPGHVLNALVVREMMADGSVDWIDTLGTLTCANQKWCQSSYQCQKVEIALPGLLNNSRVQIRDWMRTIKHVASRNSAAVDPVDFDLQKQS